MHKFLQVKKIYYLEVLGTMDVAGCSTASYRAQRSAGMLWALRAVRGSSDTVGDCGAL